MSRLRCAVLLALQPIVFGSVAAAEGRSVRFTGAVRDDTDRPVRGATITASGPNRTDSTFTVTTDQKGRFAILGLSSGPWVFAIAAPGFEAQRATTEVLTDGSNAALNVRLVRGTRQRMPPISSVPAAAIQSLIEAAESAAGRGDVAAAVAGYRDLLAKVPALTTAYLRIGALLEQSGDAAAALGAYRALRRLEPDNAKAMDAVARLERTQK